MPSAKDSDDPATGNQDLSRREKKKFSPKNRPWCSQVKVWSAVLANLYGLLCPTLLRGKPPVFNLFDVIRSPLRGGWTPFLEWSNQGSPVLFLQLEIGDKESEKTPSTMTTGNLCEFPRLTYIRSCRQPVWRRSSPTWEYSHVPQPFDMSQCTIRNIFETPDNRSLRITDNFFRDPEGDLKKSWLQYQKEVERKKKRLKKKTPVRRKGRVERGEFTIFQIC